MAEPTVIEYIAGIEDNKRTLYQKVVNGFKLEVDNKLSSIATVINSIPTPTVASEIYISDKDRHDFSEGYYKAFSVIGTDESGLYDTKSYTVNYDINDIETGFTITPEMIDPKPYALSQVIVPALPEKYTAFKSALNTAGTNLNLVHPSVSVVNKSGEIVPGTMTVHSQENHILDATKTNGVYSNKSYTIPAGYHDGSCTISIEPKQISLIPLSTEQVKYTAKKGEVVGEVIVEKFNLAAATDGNATSSDILATKTAWVDGVLVTGTMADKSNWSGTLDLSNQSVTIPAGYHNGSGAVSIDLARVTAGTAIAENILSGKTAYVNGVSVTGQMPNNAAWNGEAKKAGNWAVTIPAGYHNGSGKVTVPEVFSTGQNTSAADVRAGKDFIANGQIITGTLTDAGDYEMVLNPIESDSVVANPTGGMIVDSITVTIDPEFIARLAAI